MGAGSRSTLAVGCTHNDPVASAVKDTLSTVTVAATHWALAVALADTLSGVIVSWGVSIEQFAGTPRAFGSAKATPADVDVASIATTTTEPRTNRLLVLIMTCLRSQTEDRSSGATYPGSWSSCARFTQRSGWGRPTPRVRPSLSGSGVQKQSDLVAASA